MLYIARAVFGAASASTVKLWPPAADPHHGRSNSASSSHSTSNVAGVKVTLFSTGISMQMMSYPAIEKPAVHFNIGRL
jgi:hypothetical protein